MPLVESNAVSVTCKDQVVIHADVSDHKLVANEVRFGVMKGKQSMEGMKGIEGTNHK